MPSAVDLSFMVEVDQIHQQFTARGAAETRGVPAQPRARPGSEHCHFSTADVFATLENAETLDYSITALLITCRPAKVHTAGIQLSTSSNVLPVLLKAQLKETRVTRGFRVFALLMIVVCLPVQAGFS